MKQITLPFENGPELLGNPIIDQLRIVQAEADRRKTLGERKAYAMEMARLLDISSLCENTWVIGTNNLVTQGLELDLPDWAVCESEMRLAASVRTVTYISGAAATRDGLATVLKRIVKVTQPDIEMSPAISDGVLRMGGMMCTPVLDLYKWQEMGQAA